MINRCCRNQAERVGAYRVLRNKQWTMEELIDRMRVDCANQCSNVEHVLCIQDTTEFDFGNLSGRIAADDPDFGDGTHKSQKHSIFAHPTLVVDAANLTPLGFSSVRVWNRERIPDRKKSSRRSKLSLKEKESYRWALSAEETAACLPKQVRKTLIGDRENDIYEVMRETVASGCDFLIRSTHDRIADPSGTNRLSQLLQDTDSCMTFDLPLPGRRGRKKRTARMQLRYLPVSIQDPSDASESLQVYCVHVSECPESVPEGETGVEWTLLASHRVETVEQALQCVEWYKCRWLIEELFRVVKSEGFDIESAQLESGESMKKLIVLVLLAALKCMGLKLAYDRREEALDAEVLFSKEQVAVLHILMRMLHAESPRSKDGRNPFRSGSLAWAS